MTATDQGQGERAEIARLLGEVERLRAGLDGADDADGAAARPLAEDPERLNGMLAELARGLQALVGARIATADDDARRDNAELRDALDRLRLVEGTAQGAEEAAVASDGGALPPERLRFRTLLDAAPQLAWRSADGGDWVWASPQWVSYTGLGNQESMGLGWLDALHPDDRAGALAMWQHGSQGTSMVGGARVFHQADGQFHHMRLFAAAEGTQREWLGGWTDTDELVRLRQRQNRLLGELQHRGRDLLTVVRSVFERTARTARDAEEMVAHFRGRIDALARVQAGIGPDGLVDLEGLVRDELLGVGTGHDPAVVVSGPDLRLPFDLAESMALAIHELATNAVKYGALSVDDARLAVRWTVDTQGSDKGRLVLAWTETGVPVVSVKPQRLGFGRELIEEGLPYRLGATTELVFQGGGVRCIIALPLPDEASPT